MMVADIMMQADEAARQLFIAHQQLAETVIALYFQKQSLPVYAIRLLA